MPQKVYNNVEGHRAIDNGRVVEDVTSITLPDIEHPTTPIAASGMAMDVDMPNTTHLNAMKFSVAHNNGVNCRYLADPGKHFIETRAVRQRYNVAAGEIEHESVKFRVTGVHTKTNKGNIET
ncbi:MAG: phage major tail tube protein, partial [Clostridia bacterium]